MGAPAKFRLADLEADRLSPEYARIRKALDAPRMTREPVATYDQALWRLVSEELLGASEDALALARALVADIFWINDEQLRSDLAKLGAQVS